MKKKKVFLCSPGLWLATVFLALGMMASGQTVKDTRTWKESFRVSTETTLEVENKYGKILIVPWSKDSVQVTADIYLEAKNASRLRKLKNDIRISSSKASSYIIVRTLIGDGSSRVVSELRTLTNTLGSHSEVEINYTIYLPKYIDVVLTNKFGDIYIDDINGDVDISLSNGVLKANSFSGNSKLELLFAKASIHSLGTTALTMAYGELSLGTVEQLDISSKSSELDIESVGVLKLDSRRDRIEIKEVEYLYGFSTFTDIWVKDFIREADCDMKYGSLKIDNVKEEFSRVDIKSDYTDITLYFPFDSDYLVDILHNEKAVLNTPASNSNLSTRRTGDEFLTTEGFVGDRNTKKHLSIRAEHKCFINISTR